jgi:hypothetical protein
MTRRHAALVLVCALASASARTARAEEIEVTAGVVTGVDCALAARAKGDLKLLTSCAPVEATKGLVVFDVAEKRIYRLAPAKVSRWQLERAFGGGSIDFTGTTVKVDRKTEIATVTVTEFSITPRPKPGAFKGCL